MSRPLRADAARNRARVLEAADEVFGEQGPAGSTEEVARRAGVGVATVFRHFPTKADLLAAVLAARLRRVADRAAELAASDDPATAFRGFFREAVLQSTAKTLLTEALTDAGGDVRAARREVEGDLREALGTLLAGAQRVGAVRSDLGVVEIVALLAAATRAVELSPDDATRERVVGVLLDGLAGARTGPP